MKKIKLTLVLVLLASFSFGQNLLMTKKSDIVDRYREMAEGKPFKAEWGMTEESHIDYIKFEDKDSDLSKVYYFNENGVCNYYRVFYPYSYIKEVTRFLNSKLNKVDDDDVWMDYTQYADYMWVLQRYEKFFTTSCTVYKQHNIIKQ